MTGRRLYVVGTIHYDIDGRERLDALLDNLSPDIIALETSKGSKVMEIYKNPPELDVNKLMDEVKKAGLTLNERQKETVIEVERRYYREFGYELRSPMDYQKRMPKTRLEPIGLSFYETYEEFSEGYKSVMSVMIQTPEVRDKILRNLDMGTDSCIEYLRKSNKRIYDNAELLFELAEEEMTEDGMEDMRKEYSPQAAKLLEKVWDPARNEEMSRRLHELYKDSSGRIVAVVGMVHLVGMKPKIKDLDPVVFNLAEYTEKLKQARLKEMRMLRMKRLRESS